MRLVGLTAVLVAIVSGFYLLVALPSHERITSLQNKPTPESKSEGHSSPSSAPSTVTEKAEKSAGNTAEIPQSTMRSVATAVLGDQTRNKCDENESDAEYKRVYELQMQSESRTHSELKASQIEGDQPLGVQEAAESKRHSDALTNIKSNFEKNISTKSCL